MFDVKSRYAKSEMFTITDSRGRVVQITLPAVAIEQTTRGIHVLRQGERSDHLSALYLGDACAYWRIAEHNDAMTAEVLSELREIKIPNSSAR